MPYRGLGRRDYDTVADSATDNGSNSSSWEDDVDGPTDIRSQLAQLQALIFKKERECMGMEEKSKALVAQLRKEVQQLRDELEHSEEERKRLLDEIARLRQQNATDQDTLRQEFKEKLLQMQLQLEAEVQREKDHEDQLRRREYERQQRLEQSLAAEFEAKAERLKRQLEEQLQHAKDRERQLQQQAEEERRLLEALHLKREEQLRRELEEERAASGEKTKQIHALQKQLSDLQQQWPLMREELENQRREHEEALLSQSRLREEQLRAQEAAALERERELARQREEALITDHQKHEEALGNEHRKQEGLLRSQLENLKQQLDEERSRRAEAEAALEELRRKHSQQLYDQGSEAAAAARQLQEELVQQQQAFSKKREALEDEISTLRHGMQDLKDNFRHQLADKDYAEKELKASMELELQKRAKERDMLQEDLQNQLDRAQEAKMTELARQRQELEDLYKGQISALHRQIDDLRQQQVPTPPAHRPPPSGSRNPVIPPKSRPQPTPPPMDSPGRPYAAPPLSAPPTPPAPVLPPPPAPPSLPSDDSQWHRERIALLQQMDEADQHAASLKRQLDSLRRRNGELENELELMRKREDARRLADVEEAEKRIEELRQRRGSLDSTQGDLSKRLSEALLALEERNLACQRAERRVAELEADLDGYKKRLQMAKDASAADIAKLEGQLQDIDGRLQAALEVQRRAERDLMKERERAEGADGQRKYSESQLRSELANLRSELARRSEELAARSVELAAAQGELTARSAEIVTLQGQLSALQDEVKSLRQTLKERDAMLQAQCDVNAANMAKQKEMEETIRLFEADCRALQGELECLRDSLQARQAELDDAMMEAAAVRQDVDLLKEENVRLKEEHAAQREALRRELETIQDQAQALERRAAVAEAEASAQRERAEALQHSLMEKAASDAEGKRTASEALAEAAERELERLRAQLTAKGDQLLKKDRKEEALVKKLQLLVDEIGPDPDPEMDPVNASVDKVRHWKALLDEMKLRQRELEAQLAKLQGLLATQPRAPSPTKQPASPVQAVHQPSHPPPPPPPPPPAPPALGREYLAALGMLNGKLNGAKRTIDSLNRKLARQRRKGQKRAKPKPQPPPQQAAGPSLDVIVAGVEQFLQTIDERTKGWSQLSPPRPEPSPPTSSQPQPVQPVQQQADSGKRSPPPPERRTTSCQVTPRRGESEDDRPSLEQIEQLLASMEKLINQPLPGEGCLDRRRVSPLRSRLISLSPPPPPPPPPIPVAAERPRGPRSPLAHISPSLTSPETSSEAARSLLAAHESSRKRREEGIAELQGILTALDSELAELHGKKQALFDHKRATMATIEAQQTSLASNISYWRTQLSRVEGSIDRPAAEIQKCRSRLGQAEEDLGILLQQRSDVAAKAEKGEMHLQEEITKLNARRAAIETELLQLKTECEDLLRRESALHAVAATPTASVRTSPRRPTQSIPPPNELPPALPAPAMYHGTP